MFSHVMVGADDVAASKQFYDAILGALGHAPGNMDDKGRCFYFTPSGIFAITPPINGEPAAEQTAEPLASRRLVQQKRMPGTRRALIMVVQRSKTRPVSGQARVVLGVLEGSCWK